MSEREVIVSKAFRGTSGFWMLVLKEAVGNSPGLWRYTSFLAFSSKQQAEDMRQCLLRNTLNCVPRENG